MGRICSVTNICVPFSPTICIYREKGERDIIIIIVSISHRMGVYFRSECAQQEAMPTSCTGLVYTNVFT